MKQERVSFDVRETFSLKKILIETSREIGNSGHVLFWQRVLNSVIGLEEFQNPWSDIQRITAYVFFLKTNLNSTAYVVIIKSSKIDCLIESSSVGFKKKMKNVYIYYAVRLRASGRAQIRNSTLLRPGCAGTGMNSETMKAARYEDMITDV